MGVETDLIKERLNIADVVGEYVQLRQSGQNLKAPCPFHNEKTPSFFVSPNRGTWHCFGACGEGGDIFSFIQKAEGVDFPAALKILAERAGVELSKSQQASKSSSRRQRLFDALNYTAAFYHEILMNQPAGKKAKEYALSRGITEKTMKDFQMGYAPNKWDLLQHALLRKGVTENEMIDVGMVGRSQRGKLYDRFRGRLMFPVQDTRGHIVAFGGRIMPWHETGNEGKYINSPETALYEKRRVVYNLNRAKNVLRRGAACVVVEGYMDTVMLTQAGIENVVATSGTAFTEGHTSQLVRYTDTLHFAFDADSAGFKATVSATQAALAAGMKVATVVLPSGKDPADIAKEDPENLKEIMAHVEPLLLVLLKQLRVQESDQSREQQLQALLPLIRLVKNPIQQGAMVESVAEALKVPTGRIIELMQQVAAPSVSSAMRYEEAGQDAHLVENFAEKELLGILLHSSDVRQALFSYLEPEIFLDQGCLALYKSMQQLSQANSSFFSMQSDAIIDALPERERTFAEGVRALAEDTLTTSSQSPLQEGQALVRTLKRASLHSLLRHVQEEVARTNDHERIAALERFRALSQELANIDNS